MMRWRMDANGWMRGMEIEGSSIGLVEKEANESQWWNTCLSVVARVLLQVEERDWSQTECSVSLTVAAAAARH